MRWPCRPNVSTPSIRLRRWPMGNLIRCGRSPGPSPMKHGVDRNIFRNTVGWVHKFIIKLGVTICIFVSFAYEEVIQRLDLLNLWSWSQVYPEKLRSNGKKPEKLAGDWAMICHDVLSQNTWLIWVVKNTAKPPKTSTARQFFCALDLDPINLTFYYHILSFIIIIINYIYVYIYV